jgi:hypothetical protein
LRFINPHGLVLSGGIGNLIKFNYLIEFITATFRLVALYLKRYVTACLQLRTLVKEKETVQERGMKEEEPKQTKKLRGP